MTPALPATVPATRTTDEAWLGGVAAGLSRRLGWPLMLVRLVFVVLAVSKFAGVFAYAVLWLLLPLATARPQAPGVDAADRSGMRSTAPTVRASDLGTFAAFVALSGGLLWLVQLMGWGLDESLFWPILIAGCGMAIIWFQADRVSTRGLRNASGRLRLLAPLLAHWSTIVAITLGSALVGVGIWLFVASLQDVAQGVRTAILIGLAMAALVTAAAPWLLRIRRELAAIREEKLLSDARADIAAHLHDSVLQTLALIQRQASDPKAVMRLARSQERQLRAWLYDTPAATSTFGAALVEAAAEVEDSHGVDVELVTVGECPLTPDLDALVRAAGEAMVNAAKHSGATLVDVYAEVEDDRVEVFVRDRGKGFVVDDVPADRQGLAKSVRDRVARHGGRAIIKSVPNEGTEVKLEMNR